tara:strand:- start:5519 stop:5860 length:342 start_codon:yes stop_codon:yes gene_type:complete
MGVEPDFVAGGAAEEFVDGFVQHFALEIPQRHIDRADGGHSVGAAAENAAAEQVLPVAFDGQRIFADEVFGAVFDAGDGQVGRARGAATGVEFADAAQAVVGIDDDIHEAVGA